MLPVLLYQALALDTFLLCTDKYTGRIPISMHEQVYLIANVHAIELLFLQRVATACQNCWHGCIKQRHVLLQYVQCTGGKINIPCH